MPIYLDKDLTTELVKKKVGGFDELVADWEAECEINSEFPSPVTRSAVYRWAKDGVPSAKRKITGFCGLLDVDPMVLLDYHRNGFFSNFAKLRHLIQLGLTKVGVLSPLYIVYRPGPEWPSDEEALACYKRKWFAQEFNNSEHWSNDHYCLVKAIFRDDPEEFPRAVHIAYRRTDSSDTMWRYFGSVLAVLDELRLYSESGDFQTMEPLSSREIRFRTYYGGRKVEFRVASLHDFELEFEFPHDDKKTIGFEW